jgi:negative regulator of flagellin synthesis FlgM
MKIWGNIPKVPGVYGGAGKVDKPSRTNSVASRKDELTLSGEAKDFAVVMKALRAVPDIRQDKADAISARIDSGDYTVSAKDIAEKLPDFLINRKI